MGLQEDFDQAAQEATSLPNAVTNDEKLVLYGLFKQAKEGDVTGSRPMVLNVAGRAKWDAWNTNKGVSKEEAQQKYIDYVASLKAKYAA